MLNLASAILAAVTAEAAPTQEASNPFTLMSYFFIAIGAYVLYSAFTGKGQIYKNEYPASIKEDVFKMTRTLAYIEGPVLVIGGVCDLMPEVPSIVSLIMLAIGFLTVVVYLVILYKRHGSVIKPAKKPKF